jgi:hypothetical protein
MTLLFYLGLLILVSGSQLFDSVKNLAGNSIQLMKSKKHDKKYSKGGHHSKGEDLKCKNG